MTGGTSRSIVLLVLAAFVLVPAGAFATSCRSRHDTFTIGLTPAVWPGAMWTTTEEVRPGVFERRTRACGLSPRSSIDADFDRSNHTIGPVETVHVFVSSNLFGVLDREPISSALGPIGEPPRPRRDVAVVVFVALGRLLLFVALGLAIRRLVARFKPDAVSSSPRPGANRRSRERSDP